MLSTRLLAALAFGTLTAGAQTYVTPKLGGGQTAAEMVHINIYYDAELNQLQATVDDSYGIPQLRALASGYSFDPAEAYVVLNGKAYNAQYGWNAGGFFTIPAGAAIWVEALDCSPGLEVYEGSGRFSTYAPLFGTDASPHRWKWSGVMVHNTYAVHSPIAGSLFAKYHVYFGDATTGERLPQYGDTYVGLEWTSSPIQPPLPLEFGAMELTNGASLCLLHASNCTTNSRYLVNLSPVDTPAGTVFQGQVPITALAATPAHGGPISGHALPGARLQLEATALQGPPGGSLQFFEASGAVPAFTLPVGELRGTNLIIITEAPGNPQDDPFGNIQGRRFVATRPGLYCFTFRVLDTSSNPAHAPSQWYDMYLQAGATISSLTITNQSAIIIFGGERGKQFLIESSPRMSTGATWQTIAGPIAGTNYLQTEACNTLPNEKQQFFRLRIQ